jgi:hypothetical protein
MARNSKEKGYVTLSPDEWNIVTIQKVVETYWFRDPRGWWDGPDGLGLHPLLGVQAPYLHYPGIRQAMINAGVDEPYLPTGDWLLAEYVHSSQMPRCVPTAINGFIELFFGAHYTLFGHQLGMYYTPQRYNVIVGGRGAGKTIPMAIMMMVWTALHPGEPWLHVALSLDQAKKAYNAILEFAGKRHYRSDGSLTTRSFADAFIQDKREFPQTDIYFRPWDEHDGGEVGGKQQSGNTIMFRSLGDEDLERLRSTEAGEGSGDEVLREIEEQKTINHIRGCLRGLNPWLLAHLPQEKRQRINELQQRIGFGTVTGDDALVKSCEAELQAMGVDRLKRFFAIGNAGEPDWVWEVMDLADDDPRKAWFIQVSMYDNIRLSPDDRAALEEAWGSDPEARQVELLGRRPLGLGTEIDPALLIQATRRDLGGTVLQEHPAYGMIQYVKPAVEGHFHIIAGDPGKDKLPRRNSWCVIVMDVTASPAEIVFFQMGNLGSRSKTYVPYTNAYGFAASNYPTLSPYDMIYDNGGQQSGMHEVLLGSMRNSESAAEVEIRKRIDTAGFYGNPYDFSNSMKYTAANWLIDVLRKGALVMPDIRILIRQVSNWTLPDKKLAQDAAMTLFMIIHRAYYIITDPDARYGQDNDREEELDMIGTSRWSLPSSDIIQEPLEGLPIG